jgi:hypothetical protein
VSVREQGSRRGGDISRPAELRCIVGRFAETPAEPAELERGNQCCSLGRADARSAREFLRPGLSQPMEAAILDQQAGRHIQRALAGVPVPK